MFKSVNAIETHLTMGTTGTERRGGSLARIDWSIEVVSVINRGIIETYKLHALEPSNSRSRMRKSDCIFECSSCTVIGDFLGGSNVRKCIESKQALAPLYAAAERLL
jgi:hypothetical protein